MFAIYTCLTQSHDYRLVGLAAAVCLFASMVAIKLLQRVGLASGRVRAALLTVAASVTGIGIWSTHFIAMLAFQPEMPAAYDVGMTLASLAAAVAIVGAGFHLSLSRRAGGVAAAGGAVVGVGVGVMHYLGMAAFEIQGVIIWDAGLVALSILIGASLCALAGYIATKATSPRGQFAAALLFAVSICGLHFTGMGAATLLPDSSITIKAATLPGEWLAAAVAGGAFALLMLTALGLVLEQKQSDAEQRRRQELADTAVEGLVVCDRGIIVNTNASFSALSGMSEAKLRGLRFADLLEPSAADRLGSGAEERFETVLHGPEDEVIPVMLFTRSLSFNGRLHQGVAVRDLRARNLADAQIRFLAHHDALTGLCNRASFHERLEREVERRRRKEDALAVLCLDLDRFKPINDVFGHAAGDAVLKEISARIAAELDEDDVFARLGGDEFAVIRLGDSRPAALGDLCSRILAAVAPELSIDGRSALVGVSIGIAMFPHDGDNPASLMRNADAALYRAKADGRGAFRFFEAAIGAELLDRQGLEFDLRLAIARDELRLVYQPQTSVTTGEAFGFESLLRWQHPTRGNVPPDQFIPIAEDNGLILPIGEWVLRKACAEAASWRRPLQIAVNLSGVQLHSANLPAMIAEILAETGLAAERLELEITETALIQDFDHALDSLHAIKALGVKVAMDDFGTGYSSLSNLRAFPFDKIKIDQSFVRNVHLSEEGATIVRAIVGLAKGLKLTVLAEGVESLEELSFLGSEMCAEAQGYYFGRPGEISEFAALTSAPPPARLKAS